MSETFDLAGLYCEVYLPLSWSPCDLKTCPSSTSKYDNESRLKVILALDETIHDSNEDSSDLNHELQRLDNKINVILELLGRIVTQTNPLPDVVQAKLGPRAIQWQARENIPVPGQRIELQLYLDQRFPFPLSMIGAVRSIDADESGTLVSMVFDEVSEHLLQGLEKYIFRCHRRHVARMKSTESD